MDVIGIRLRATGTIVPITGLQVCENKTNGQETLDFYSGISLYAAIYY